MSLELESKQNLKHLAKEINKAAEKVFSKEVEKVYDILSGATAIYEELTEDVLINTLESVMKSKMYFHFTSEEIIEWEMLKNAELMKNFFNETNLRFKLMINKEKETFQISDLKMMKLDSSNVDLDQVEDVLNDVLKIDFDLYAQAFQSWFKKLRTEEFINKVSSGYECIEREVLKEDPNAENLMQKFALKKAYFDTLLRIDNSIQLPDIKGIGRILNASQLTDKQKRELLIKDRLSKVVQLIEFPYENQKYISIVKDRDIEEFLSLAKVRVEIVFNLIEDKWDIGEAYIDWSQLTKGKEWDNKYYVAKELGLKMKEKEDAAGNTSYFVDYEQFTQATCNWIKSNLVLREGKLKEDVMEKVELFKMKSKDIVK